MSLLATRHIPLRLKNDEKVDDCVTSNWRFSFFFPQQQNRKKRNEKRKENRKSQQHDLFQFFSSSFSLSLCFFFLLIQLCCFDNKYSNKIDSCDSVGNRIYIILSMKCKETI